jgi:hypothetical protein
MTPVVVSSVKRDAAIDPAAKVRGGEGWVGNIEVTRIKGYE